MQCASLVSNALININNKKKPVSFKVDDFIVFVKF